MRSYLVAVFLIGLHANAWAGPQDCLRLADNRAVAACAERYRTQSAPSSEIRHAGGNATIGPLAVAPQPTATNHVAAYSSPPSNTTQGAAKTDTNSDTIFKLGMVFGGIYLFGLVFGAVFRGAAKAAKATVYVGAAATGLTVGVVEGAVRTIAERYCTCPYCLSVIRTGASVCKHCLRTFSKD